MSGFSIGTGQGMRYLNRADNSSNPYSSFNQNGDGVATADEIGARLTQLQNNPYSPGAQQEGSFWQTIMTGNGGQGYYDMISQLDGQAGISQQDLSQLSQMDGNRGDITQDDFLNLRDQQQNQGQNGGMQMIMQFMMMMMQMMMQMFQGGGFGNNSGFGGQNPGYDYSNNYGGSSASASASASSGTGINQYLSNFI